MFVTYIESFTENVVKIGHTSESILKTMNLAKDTEVDILLLFIS